MLIDLLTGCFVLDWFACEFGGFPIGGLLVFVRLVAVGWSWCCWFTVGMLFVYGGCSDCCLGVFWGCLFVFAIVLC